MTLSPRKAARLLARLLSGSEPLYRFCRKVVDCHNGDNDPDPRSNGELRLMRRILPTSRVVFDVGANVGVWTLEALRIAPDAAFHLFEPSPRTFRQLQDRGFPANVHLNCFGLSDRSAELDLHVFAEGSSANTLYQRVGTAATACEVERVRLESADDYCRTRGIEAVDLMKVDVEGHELSVLRGASDLLRSGAIGAVQFEYGGTYIDAGVRLRDLFELVRGLNSGYRFYKLFPNGPRHIPEYTQQLETYQYSNWAILLE